MTTVAARPVRAASPITQEVELLLLQYPRLSEEELDRLIYLYPRLPILDAGLITADERLAPKLDAFYAAQGHRIRMPLSHLAIILAIPTLYFAVVLWFLLRG